MKKRYLVITFIIILSLLIIYNRINFNDNMQRSGIYNINYKTMKQNNNWTVFKGNGVRSGNKSDSIKNMFIKTKSPDFSHNFYTNKKWTKDILTNQKINNNKPLQGIKVFIYKDLAKKYSVCYRTYNIKNGWLGWSCNGQINGNKKYDISAIEIKVIPKNIVTEEYLKDYNNSSKTQINF